MSISPRFTTAEIREFVHEYQRAPHGKLAVWVAKRELTYDTLRRWQSAVFEGDLDRDGAGGLTSAGRVEVRHQAMTAIRGIGTITGVEPTDDDLGDASPVMPPTAGELHTSPLVFESSTEPL